MQSADKAEAKQYKHEARADVEKTRDALDWIMHTSIAKCHDTTVNAQI